MAVQTRHDDLHTDGDNHQADDALKNEQTAATQDLPIAGAQLRMAQTRRIFPMMMKVMTKSSSRPCS